MRIWRCISECILFPKDIIQTEWMGLPSVSPFMRVESGKESRQLQEHSHTTAVGVGAVRQPLKSHTHTHNKEANKHFAYHITVLSVYIVHVK